MLAANYAQHKESRALISVEWIDLILIQKNSDNERFVNFQARGMLQSTSKYANSQ